MTKGQIDLGDIPQGLAPQEAELYLQRIADDSKRGRKAKLYIALASFVILIGLICASIIIFGD